MPDIANSEATDRLLSALGEQLAALGQRFELVVVGGSGLLALGLIERSTRDVDVLALRAGWSRSHDPSEGYAQMLRNVLSHLGVDDVDLGP